nr:MAG TPA: hypothetical protein [Caudoviricetes sp.]
MTSSSRVILTLFFNGFIQSPTLMNNIPLCLTKY